MNVFEFLMMHLIWGDQYIDGPMDPKIGGTGPPGPHGGCAYVLSIKIDWLID